MTDWINCSEKLPENGEIVYLYCPVTDYYFPSTIHVGYVVEYYYSTGFSKTYFCDLNTSQRICRDVTKWSKVEFPKDENE